MTKGTPAHIGVDSLTTKDLSFTQMGGTSRKLLVGISVASSGTITTATLGGTNLTPVGTIQNGAFRCYLYERNNASTGTITIIFSGNVAAVIGYLEWSEANQAALSATTASATDATGTITIGSVATGETMFALFGHEFPEVTPHNVGGGQTSEWDDVSDVGGNESGVANTKPGAGGSLTETIDVFNVRAWTAIAVVIQPAAPPPTLYGSLGQFDPELRIAAWF